MTLRQHGGHPQVLVGRAILAYNVVQAHPSELCLVKHLVGVFCKDRPRYQFAYRAEKEFQIPFLGKEAG